MKIYMDITNLISSKFVSGIQRVVLECAKRFDERDDIELVLLEYKSCDTFRIVSSEEFLYKFYYKGKDIFSNNFININDIEKNSYFYDVDAVWNSALSRNYLYDVLKNKGVKVAVFIHDILPMTMPEFFDINLIYSFSIFMAAVIKYADIILVSTNANKVSVEEICSKLNEKCPYIGVTGLGGDYQNTEIDISKVREDVLNYTKDRKYGLIVGTIEPRKNHKLLLDLFDDERFPKDLSMVFAGRIGWKNDEILRRIDNHPEKGNRFEHFVGLNNESISYLYKHAYVSFFPTYNEGYGLPIVESFQNNVPVIASDIPVLREVGKETALYCELNNIDSWIEAINDMLNDSNMYESIKNKIKTYNYITWNDVIKNMVFYMRNKRDINEN